jgi:capsular polysaccharide transport system permease protein
MSSSLTNPDLASATPALEVLRTSASETGSTEHVSASPMPASDSFPAHAPTPDPVRSTGRPGIIRRALSWCARNPLFFLTVAIPTSLAIGYYGYLAPDIYVSESRFVIRSPQPKAPTGLGAILQGNSLTRSHDDTFTVHDFIHSRDALRILMERLPLRETFSTTEVFPLSSFPNFMGDESFDALHRYYQKHVSVSVDSTSSISMLAVRTFRPKDAFAINETLLELSEKLINDLNARARQDLIQFASSEVKQAEEKAKAAALALSAYRNEKQVFDPERQSTVQLQQIAKLQEELITSKTQLAQLEDASIQSPQIQALKKRIQILSSEITSETDKVVGVGSSLAQKAAEYERLSLDRAFAEKSLATALASLETARNEAQRKQLYLERIVSPNLPDRSFEPKRIKGTVEVFLLGLIAWGIGSMLIAGVREHQD